MHQDLIKNVGNYSGHNVYIIVMFVIYNSNVCYWYKTVIKKFIRDLLSKKQAN